MFNYYFSLPPSVRVLAEFFRLCNTFLLFVQIIKYTSSDIQIIQNQYFSRVRSIDPCCCSVAKSCLTFCNPVDCSPPGSSVHGFPRQEYCSGLPFPSPGDFSDPGIEPGLLPQRQILYHLSHQGSSRKYLYKI